MAKAVEKQIMGEMPHNLEAEQALLCCLLIDARVQVEIAAYLKEEDFYAESHVLIYRAMLDIIKENKPIDIITLTDALEKLGTLSKVGGIQYVTELTNVVPSSANYNRYLEIVTRDGLLRRLIKGSAEIIEECKVSQDTATALSFAEKTVYDISNDADTSEVVKISTVIPDVITRIEEVSRDKTKLRGLKTGYRELDFILNGVNPGALVILAARPAVGKTSFAMNIVENVALAGYSCAVFSLEMTKEEIAQRLLCSVGKVSMENVKKGSIDAKEWRKIAKAREVLSQAKIFVDDSSIIRPREIISKCRRIKRKSGLDFVMIDYIGLMTPDKVRKSDNRQNEISEISRSLKILAKELNVPVLALSQLNRAIETRKGRPQLADLRESGAIEQDADVVMFIHRPDKSATEKEIAEGKVQPNVAEIIVEKNRSGRPGTAKLYFKGEYTKFLNINTETGEVEEEGTNNKIKVNVDGYEALPQADKAESEEQDIRRSDVEPLASTLDEEIF